MGMRGALNCLNAPFSSFSRACHAEHRRWKCKSAKLKLVASGRCVCSPNARIRMCSRTSRRQTACASPGSSNCQLQRLPFERRPMVTEMMPPVIDCKCWGVVAVNETHTHASVEERKCRGKKAEREREREVCGAGLGAGNEEKYDPLRKDLFLYGAGLFGVSAPSSDRSQLAI